MSMKAETKKQFEQEEQAYWRQRTELLKRYRDKWVAVVGGQVVATGDRSGEVIREAHQKTGSTVGYVVHVGHEDEVQRIRQVAAGYYDHVYSLPLPKVITSVRHLTDGAAMEVELIVDTGADLTVVRHTVADVLGLWDSPWRTANIAGVGSASESRQLYAGIVRLADHDTTVEVDCRDDIDEDILGRDVINEFSLTVCAKRGQVEFEWVPTSGSRT